MTSNTAHDQLERYLLGTLPEAERERIDERILTDGQLFDDLCVVENELAYDYAIGLLTPEERRRFEERFLYRPAIRARVRTAVKLMEGIRSIEHRQTPRRGQWAVYAAAAASLVLVAWLARENLRLRNEAETTRTAAVPASSARNEPAPAPIPPPTQVDRTPSQNQAPARGDGAVPLVLTLSLQPGVVRSTAAPVRVRLPQGANLRLQLVLPSGTTAFQTYRATMRTPDDTEVWSESSRPTAADGGLAFTIPGRAIPANDYEITLYGLQPGKDPEEIANYTVSVLRQ